MVIPSPTALTPFERRKHGLSKIGEEIPLTEHQKQKHPLTEASFGASVADS
jgi:hypothetical protein